MAKTTPRTKVRKDKRLLRLRKLKAHEQKHLKTKLADKNLERKYYVRYRIIDELAQGRGCSEIASRCDVHVHTVYRVAGRFDRDGFEYFEAPPNPEGRHAELSSEQITRLIKVALSRPKDLGLPFTQWSTAKLKEYCQQKKLYPADYSSEWLRRLLRREGITFQRTKTWKESPDPDFESKKTAS
jgi:transposase